MQPLERPRPADGPVVRTAFPVNQDPRHRKVTRVFCIERRCPISPVFGQADALVAASFGILTDE